MSTSGKKIYLVCNSDYGLTRGQRNTVLTPEVEKHIDLSKEIDPYEQVKSVDSTAQYSVTLDALVRAPLEHSFIDPDHVYADPLAALNGHYYTAQGPAGGATMVHLSESMSDSNNIELMRMFSVGYDEIASSIPQLNTTTKFTGVSHYERDTEYATAKASDALFGIACVQRITVMPPNGLSFYDNFVGKLYAPDVSSMTPEATADDLKEKRNTAQFLYNKARHFLNVRLENPAMYRDGNPPVYYYNYTTTVTAPFTPREADLLASDAIMSAAEVNPEYNYYVETYEKYLPYMPEKALPNLMLWAAMGNDTGDSYKRSLALSNFTLGQTAALSKFANYGQELGSNYWQTFGHILGEAVNQFAGTPADPADGDAIEAYKNKSLQGIRDWNPLLDVTMHSQWHLVFSGDYTGTIEDSRLMREQFPLHVDVSFDTHNINQFADLLGDANMMPTVIDFLIGNLDETGNIKGSELIRELADSNKPVIGSSYFGSSGPGYNAVFEGQPMVDLKERDDGSMALDVRMSIQAKKRLELDFGKMLDKITVRNIDTTGMKGRTHVTADEKFGTRNGLERQLKTLIAKGKMTDFVANHLRSYQEVMEGKHAYNEVLVYRVTKYDESDVAVQNYWFANSSKISSIDFVDTQVQYGRTYTYRIYAYTLIIGNKYNFSMSDTTLNPTDYTRYRNALASPGTAMDLNEFLASEVNFDVLEAIHDQNLIRGVCYEPCLKIVETMVYAQRAMTYDSPPVVPEFQIVPYKGMNNKLLLICKGTVGRTEELPITVTVGAANYGPGADQTEEEVQTQQAMYQDITAGEPQLFESDDRPAYFEIFRTTEGPYNYGDWNESLYATMTTLLPTETQTYPATNIRPKYADHASMIDTLQPNTKYYYMVRQVDVHGNVSNPTPMYCVELVDENGMVYPVIEEYEFRPLVPSKLKKKFNKYIKIAPTPAQVLINSETLRNDSGITSAFNAADGNVQLGVSDTNLWGKTFKVRITSETTGKAADININFAQKHEKTLTETGQSVDDPDSNRRFTVNQTVSEQYFNRSIFSTKS